MQFSTIKTQVAYNLGRGLTQTQIIAQDDTWVNNWQREICNMRNWWFMRAYTTQALTVVTTSTEYNLPAYSAGPPVVWAYKDMIAMYVKETATTDKSYKMMKGPVSDIDMAKLFDTDTDDEPEYWTFRPSKKYCVFPYADDSYTIYIRYWGYLPDMSADADANELVDFAPELLIAGATAKGFEYLQEYQDAMYWRREVQKRLADLRAMDCKKKLGPDFTIIPRWGTEDAIEPKQGGAARNYY